MTAKLIGEEYRALYPDDLLAQYAAGERDFSRINLLRAELEDIAARRSPPPEAPRGVSEKYNPLWCDFRNPIDPEFEWDSYGSFIPTEFDDLISPRDLSGACLSEVVLDGSYLYPINLANADLRASSLRNAILLHVDLRNANLSHADMRWAAVGGDLTGANLYMARLEHASLAGCKLRGADLRRSKLRGTNLEGADLRTARLAKAKFSETNLNGADVRGVDFDDVTLDSVYVSGMTLDVSQVGDLLKALRITLHDNGERVEAE
jgi:uncharacterized protein YjbI with pentapeptide repeats